MVLSDGGKTRGGFAGQHRMRARGASMGRAEPIDRRRVSRRTTHRMGRWRAKDCHRRFLITLLGISPSCTPEQLGYVRVRREPSRATSRAGPRLGQFWVRLNHRQMKVMIIEDRRTSAGLSLSIPVTAPFSRLGSRVTFGRNGCPDCRGSSTKAPPKMRTKTA